MPSNHGTRLNRPRNIQNIQKRILNVTRIKTPMVMMPRIKEVGMPTIAAGLKFISPINPSPTLAIKTAGMLIKKLNLRACSALYWRNKRTEVVNPDLLRPGRIEKACTTPSKRLSFKAIGLSPSFVFLKANLCITPVTIKRKPIIAVANEPEKATSLKPSINKGKPITPPTTVAMIKKVINLFSGERLKSLIFLT